MKRVTFMVEFVARIKDDVEPEDVSFDIPTDQVRAQAGGNNVGVLESYTTQEYPEVNQEGLPDEKVD